MSIATFTARVLTLALAHAEPPDAQVLFTFTAPVPGDRFGTAVAGAGDVNRDGWPDLIAGAPRAEPNGPVSGTARVLSGRGGVELFTFEGDEAYDAQGHSVDGAGDVDGDGHPDLVVGSPAGTPPAGSVRVYSGRDGGLLWTWVGVAAGDRFGHAVAGAGDVDGDGCADVVVGAPHHDGAGPNAGRATVFSGRDGRRLLELEGAPWDQLGAAVAGAGDLDGDGHADVLLGAPLSDVGAFNGGSALAISGRDGTLLAAFHGAGIGDLLGSSVARVGDVDGDGAPDVALGAPGADVGGIDSGAVEVRSVASGALLLSIAGESSAQYLGAVAGAGDVDADGRADLVVGAASAAAQAGRVRIVSGRTGADLAAFDGADPNDWLGAAVAGVGDVDGDGRPDVIAGAPGHDDFPLQTGYVLVLSGAEPAAGPLPRFPTKK